MLTGRFAVLDIETAPSDAALSLVGRADRAAGERSALHEMTAFTALTFERSTAGGFAGFAMTTRHHGEGDEPELLAVLSECLDPVHRAGGSLTTFNGVAHDLPVVLRRASRHWLFDRFDWPAWLDGSRHLDLMRSGPGAGGGRWHSLVDRCAALGFSAALEPRSLVDGAAPAVARKCQLDVIATFVLLVYDMATDERSDAAVVAGLDALSRFLRSPVARGAPHLEHFARHPFCRAARSIAAGR